MVISKIRMHQKRYIVLTLAQGQGVQLALQQSSIIFGAHHLPSLADKNQIQL